MSWPQTIEGFELAQRTLGVALRTRCTQRSYLRQLADFAGEVDPGPLSRATLLAFFEKPGWTGQRRRTALAAVDAFYAWCIAQGLCTQNPVANTPGSRVGRRTRPAPSLAEIDPGLPLGRHLAWCAAKGLRDATILQRWRSIYRFRRVVGCDVLEADKHQVAQWFAGLTCSAGALKSAFSSCDSVTIGGAKLALTALPDPSVTGSDDTLAVQATGTVSGQTATADILLARFGDNVLQLGYGGGVAPDASSPVASELLTQAATKAQSVLKP